MGCKNPNEPESGKEELLSSTYDITRISTPNSINVTVTVSADPAKYVQVLVKVDVDGKISQQYYTNQGSNAKYSIIILGHHLPASVSAYGIRR